MEGKLFERGSSSCPVKCKSHLFIGGERFFLWGGSYGEAQATRDCNHDNNEDDEDVNLAAPPEVGAQQLKVRKIFFFSGYIYNHILQNIS